MGPSVSSKSPGRYIPSFSSSRFIPTFDPSIGKQLFFPLERREDKRGVPRMSNPPRGVTYEIERGVLVAATIASRNHRLPLIFSASSSRKRNVDVAHGDGYCSFLKLVQISK